MALYFAQWLFVAISIRGNQANRQIVVRLRHSQRRFSSQVGGLSAFLPDSKCNSSEELRRLTILNSTQPKYSDDTPRPTNPFVQRTRARTPLGVHRINSPPASAETIIRARPYE